MFPHPIMVHTVSELRRQERLTAVERERQAVMVAGSDSRWQTFAVDALSGAASAVLGRSVIGRTIDSGYSSISIFARQGLRLLIPSRAPE